MLSGLSGKASTKAKIVHWNQSPCLLARFSTSTPPMVWQLDLQKMTSYTITVVQKDGAWDLGYTVPQSDFTVIAHFDERHDADYAYDAIQKALLDSSQPVLSAGGCISGGGTVRRVIVWALVVLVLVALGSFFVGGGSKTRPTELDSKAFNSSADGHEGAGSGGRVISAGPQKIQDGVPMSADDVLPKE